VPGLRVRLSDAQAQSEFSIQPGMREEEVAAAIQAVHDGLIRRVPTFVAEADQVQGRRCGEFEVLVVAHPMREYLRQLHVAADMVL
jgi:hypothetical protein